MNLANPQLFAEVLLAAAGTVSFGKIRYIAVETALTGSLTVSGLTATNQAIGAPLLQTVLAPATAPGIYYPAGGGQGWPITYVLSNPGADAGKCSIVYAA